MRAAHPPLTPARKLGTRTVQLSAESFARRLRAVRRGTDPGGVRRSHKRRRDSGIVERVARQLNPY